MIEFTMSWDGYGGDDSIWVLPQDFPKAVSYVKKQLSERNYDVLSNPFGFAIDGIPNGMEKYSKYFDSQRMVNALDNYRNNQLHNPFNFLATLYRLSKLAIEKPLAYLALDTFLYDITYWEKLDDCIANFEYGNFKLANIGKLTKQKGYILVENKDNGLAVLTNGFIDSDVITARYHTIPREYVKKLGLPIEKFNNKEWVKDGRNAYSRVLNNKKGFRKESDLIHIRRIPERVILKYPEIKLIKGDDRDPIVRGEYIFITRKGDKRIKNVPEGDYVDKETAKLLFQRKQAIPWERRSPKKYKEEICSIK